MKLEECKLLDILKQVKVLNDETIDILEKIVNKKGYAKGASVNPYIEIESLTGKIVNQQLIKATYYEINQENSSLNSIDIYAYLSPNKDVIIGGNNFIETKLRYIRESILFDLYIQKTCLKFNKKLIEKYKQHNKDLLESFLSHDDLPFSKTGIAGLVNDKTYNDFILKSKI